MMEINGGGYDRGDPTDGYHSSTFPLTSADAEDPSDKAKEREALLWLVSVAHGNVRDELKEPYYFDGQGRQCLKPDYVLGLTSGELYAYALGNIYRNPSFRNFTHAEIIQFVGKKGHHLIGSNGTPVTETDLGFSRPLRLRAHLQLMDVMMILAKKESQVPNGVLKDSARLQADRFPAGKKTGFAPLPNTTTWLDYSTPEKRSNGTTNGVELPENHFQPSHPQVMNIRLALEEKRRKLQGEASKKGHEWMQQVAKAGETAFMQFAAQVGSLPQQESSDEHLYEEISENKRDADGEVFHRRARWNEQDDYDGSGETPTNTYATKQPPKPLPRRNIGSSDTVTRRTAHNGDFDAVDDGRSQDDMDQIMDPALQQFIPSPEPTQKPAVRVKPKVIRNPLPPSTLNNGHGGMMNPTGFSGLTADRLRSPVVQREFANNINVLNPQTHSKSSWSQGSQSQDESEEQSEKNPTGFELIDQNEDYDMERKKQKLIMSQLKRRAEQEAARLAKERENSDRTEMIRQRQEENTRKREEERIRRQIVFDQYQKRKAETKTAEDLPSSQNVTMRESKSKGRARPISVHANSITHHAPPPPVVENNRMKRSPSQELSILSLHNPRLAAASARQASTVERRTVSPPPPSRFRTPTVDSISDGGSSNSETRQEYTGPKLFKKPSAKSNRLIVHNAIRDCCLPGIVNEDVQKRVLDTLARCDGSNFLVLFRDANCQFKALYSYDPDINEAVKIFGAGPTKIDDNMTEKLYKYNSGSKKFAVVPTTHHMSVQIDGITIQAALWYGKKVVGLKPPLDVF